MKKWLLLGAVGFIGMAMMAGDSLYKKYKEFFDKMTYLIGTISDLNISLSRIKFKIQPVIKNNTYHELSISTFGVASIEKIEVVDKKGKTIGIGYTYIDSFKVGEYEAVKLPKIEIEIPITVALLNLTTIDYSSFEAVIKNFRFVMHIKVAGKQLQYNLSV